MCISYVHLCGQVCIPVCVYMCVHVCTHIKACLYMFVFMCVHLWVPVYICAHVCVRVWCTCVSIHVSVVVFPYTVYTSSMSMFVYMCIYFCVYIVCVTPFFFGGGERKQISKLRYDNYHTSTILDHFRVRYGITVQYYSKVKVRIMKNITVPYRTICPGCQW